MLESHWDHTWEKAIKIVVALFVSSRNCVQVPLGICAIDPSNNSITVFATYVRCEDQTGRMIATPAKPTTVKEPANIAPEPTKPAKKSRITDIQPEAVVRVHLNPNLPPDVARKFSELQASATLFRQSDHPEQANRAAIWIGDDSKTAQGCRD